MAFFDQMTTPQKGKVIFKPLINMIFEKKVRPCTQTIAYTTYPQPRVNGSYLIDFLNESNMSCISTKFQKRRGKNGPSPTQMELRRK